MKKTRLKVIALDFDGTLVESNNIKDRAFETIFCEWPEHKETMMRWHLTHDSIERGEKFGKPSLWRPIEGVLIHVLFVIRRLKLL